MRIQVEVPTEDDITEMSRKASSVTLATLRQRPPQRPYVRNPFEKVDYTTREAYQVAAEGYMRGVINPTPCDGYARGVEPHTRGLPIYPECVSVHLHLLHHGTKHFGWRSLSPFWFVCACACWRQHGRRGAPIQRQSSGDTLCTCTTG